MKIDRWPEPSEAVESRLRSAAALVEFARSSPDFQNGHRKRPLNEAIWFWTARGQVSLKYRLQYRTPAAFEVQGARSASAAKLLSHEHVHERAKVVAKLLEPTSNIDAVLRASYACVVTKAEHKTL